MYIGIDLGGTNIAVGLVDDTPKVVAKTSRPTGAERPYSEIIKDMAELCIELTENAGIAMEKIQGIGIGSPGTVDPCGEVVIYANNLNWHNVPVVKELKKYFPNTPIKTDNDANVAAYGEYAVNGNGAESFIAVTLGTGVGGGIILNNKIYKGFNGSGAEIGHFVMNYGGEPCSCGRCGCWESYASVTALIRQTKEAIAKNPDSLMAKMAEEEGYVSGKTSFDAAKKGDSVAQGVVSNYLKYVADGIVSIVNIFQPNIMVIGGGISKEGDYLLKPIKEYLAKYVYCSDVAQTQLKIATLFNDAGIIGAALISVI